MSDDVTLTKLSPAEQKRLNNTFVEALGFNYDKKTDYKAMEALLAEGAETDAIIGNLRFTPLTYAIEFKMLELTRWLLEHGACTDARAYLHNRPLYYALQKPWPEGAALVLEYQKDFSENGVKSCLALAMLSGNENIALSLIEKGAPYQKGIEYASGSLNEKTPPIAIAAQSDCLKVLTRLHEKGERLDEPVAFWCSEENRELAARMLAFAAYGKGTVTLAYLHDHGAPLSDPDFSPLCAAAMSNNHKGLSYLLQAGANPNECFSGRTALLWALEKGHGDATRLLLNHGVDTRHFLKAPNDAPFETQCRHIFLQQLQRDESMARTAIRGKGNVVMDETSPRGALHRLFTERHGVEIAARPLRRLAGAGKLGQLFLPEDWQHRDPQEAQALLKRMATALPEYDRSNTMEVDLIWARNASPETSWRNRPLTKTLPKGAVR